ncbi:DUF2680 domain-containing protein [Peribacillus kribbensis]|uniref:DUF2680 domain-containing protein n=1 Tax=Peribacillus kribbensis TaxID=356658 RepID=UPI0004269F15|nr:DUF2680 domain-containing protein [Peribacillus kribbensis]
MNLRKFLLSITGVILLSFSAGSMTMAESQGTEAAKPELSQAQKDELAGIQKSILQQKKQLIKKYVEYGIISKEKGDRILARFEEHSKWLEKNGYAPHFFHERHGRRHHEKPGE